MTHDQRWFEMSDVISNRHGDGEWTLLWAYEVLEDGDLFSAPYVEEIFRVRTILSPVTKKHKLFLRWHDVDTDNVYPASSGGRYFKLGSYYLGFSELEEAGEYGAYSYRIASGENSDLVVNPDLVAALGLKMDGDVWSRPSEGNLDVIRIERDDKGKKIRIKIRTEILKDYLCARGMGLYVEEFRHRQEQNVDGSEIHWERSPYIEERITRDGNGKYEWKGWMFRHVNRDSWDDVQSIQDTILTFPAYYRVEGQLWKQYWVNPAKLSTRVADDELNLEFYVRPNGDKHVISAVDDFKYGHVYLFFKIGLVKKLLDAGLVISWAARDVFEVSSPNGGRVLCGISKKGNVFAISADVAREDSWVQLLYHSENIKPEEQKDYIGCELFQNQMMCEFLSTKAPEDELKCLVKELEDVFEKKTGKKLWKDNNDQIISSVSRFLSTDEEGYVHLAKMLTEATAERLDESALKKFIDDRVKIEGFRSISLLGVCVNLINPSIDGKMAVQFLRDVNEIRQVDAHYMPISDKQKKLSVLPCPNDMSFVERGKGLIDYMNQGLKKLILSLSC